MIVVPSMMLSIPVLELFCVVCVCLLLAEPFHFPLRKVNWLVLKFHVFSCNMSYQFYRFHAIICQYFAASRALLALLAINSGMRKSMFKMGFMVFSQISSAKFSICNISNT
jgi:hypothetical protein